MADFEIRPVLPALPIRFDAQKCLRCGSCVAACPIDVLAQAPGQVPFAAYAEECWYCGCCVMECPAGAIQLRHPLMNEARFIEKKKLLEEKE